MSPVEPRPVVMGTIGPPSTESFDGLAFLPKMPAALSSAGANSPPHNAPSVVRNERRFPPAFRFMRSCPLSTKLVFSNWGWRSDDLGATDDFNQRIAGNPFDRHAGARGSLAGGEIGSVDFI